jgi:hypothetical protein
MPYFCNLLYISFLLILSIISVSSVSAQIFKQELSFTTENDIYFYQDRYYTSGTFVNYRYATGAAKRINNPNLIKTTTEFEFGHEIYTPYSAKAPDPALHDRPFTGYLYGAAAFNRFYKNESMLRFKAEAGIIGPPALGKEVQMGYHDLLNIYKPKGWEYQLKSEPGLNLSLDYQNMLLRSSNKMADVTLVSSALLGNTFSGANLGMLIRLGKLNYLYESITNNSLISLDPPEKKSWELFLYTIPRINYVAYDATIMGGLFLKDKGPITFDAKRFVYSQQIGISLSAERWSANYNIVLKSREVKSEAKAHAYGSISLAYRFNY